MLLLIGSFLILLIIGVPVALSMAVSSLIYVLVDGTMADFAVLHRMIGGVDSFPLLAVPFFILAGNLMNIAGVTNRIYQFAVHAVGWMRGGLGQVNIIGSVIFSGMSGTAIADAAGLGTITTEILDAPPFFFADFGKRPLYIAWVTADGVMPRIFAYSASLIRCFMSLLSSVIASYPQIAVDKSA